MKNKTLLLYIVLMFIIIGITPILPKSGASVYLSLAILLAGMLAIVFQTKIYRARFVDLGFRLNRNAIIGIGIALLFSLVAIFVFVGLPYYLGFAEFVINQESAVVSPDVSPFNTVLVLAIGGGAILFAASLFGEELAFRGYILPQLEKEYGSLKAIVLCSGIFALWHLPAYFSLYSGGAGETGWISIGIMLIAHGISTVPLCLLYLTTRELYGVSLYHAVVDIFQYSIVRNPAFGDAAKDAVYNMTVSNDAAITAIGWGWQVASIFLMLGLCKMAQKWTLTSDSIANYSS